MSAVLPRNAVNRPLRITFIIQGEGRGHMTQAIALRRILVEAGHDVPVVLLGRNARRDVPQFFIDRVGCPVVGFQSPNFVVDAQRKGIRVWPTIYQNLLRFPQYFASLQVIKGVFDEVQPDIVINFYDALAGLANMLYRFGEPFVCLGHQYLLGHPEIPVPASQKLDFALLQINTWWTALGATQRLGLSFRPIADWSEQRTYVTPPLLRQEVLELADRQIPQEDFFLAYMVNDGYAEDLMAEQKKYPHLRIHAFWDRRGMPNPYEPQPGLSFHQLDDRAFLDYMSRCKGYLTTAGFESVCEALLLGKPVYMVPTAGHVEQKCNALDAALSGAGIHGTRFDLSAFIAYLPEHKQTQTHFGAWVRSAGKRMVTLLERGC